MEQRLSGSVASQLSFAGCITLTQSVLQAIPIYAIHTTNLPISIKNKIDQICIRFLWSGNDDLRKMSLISWHTICQPKLASGLGFKRLDIINEALLLKVAWNLITEPGKFCTQLYPPISSHSVWLSFVEICGSSLGSRQAGFTLECW